MQKKYYSNYVGMVVQNSDPEKCGRLKIFVPHVSVNLYEGWNQESIDKVFGFPDQESNSDITNIMEKLKEVLPWSECALPLFGGNASGRYNNPTNSGTASDSNFWENQNMVDGQRPLHNYEHEKEYPDAFTDTGKVKNQNANPYSNNYTPSNYSNLAKGLFTIPNVGSHVWVFFKEGDPSSPVYFASTYGEDDWRRIYTLNQENENDGVSIDYPGTYENISKKDGADIDQDDSKTFRSKTVFNSNKHSIELIDTDNREILKMTHYSGSFKEFSNNVSTELAIANDQKQVLGDQFLTVRKNRSMFIEGGNERIIKGSDIQWIGLSDQDKVKEIIGLYKELNKYKRLFDIKRASINDIGPKQVSSLQERIGTFAKCPVCKGDSYAPNRRWWSDALPRATPLYLPIISSMLCTNATFTVNFFPDPLTDASAPGKGQVGYFKGSKCNVCNGTHLDTFRPYNWENGAGIGFSPASELGAWDENDTKTLGIKNWIEEHLETLIDLEKQLDDSNQIITISNNKIETIGLAMNDIPSIRTDTFGKMRVDGVHLAPEGIYTTYKPTPLVEYVDVDDIPGGDYNLTVSNKYKLLVGARGINIKTFGPIDMYGTIVNLAAEQVNISSQNDLNINGGERVSLRARIISLEPYEHNPVLINGQLHVTRNAIIEGATMIEGELGVTHITGPSQYYETLPGTSSQTEIAGQIVGQDTDFSPHSHAIPPHTHYFINLPMNLLKSPIEVRSKMITRGINGE